MNIKKSFKRWWRRFTKKTRPFPPRCPDCGEVISTGKGVKCGQCSSVICIDCWKDFHQWCHGRSPSGGYVKTYKSNGKIIIRR